MTITTSNIDTSKASFFTFEKTNDEKAEEKAHYNSFMNFMADIIVKYGLNENEQ